MADPKRYAIVRDGVVENIVLWDGDDKRWTPPSGVLMVESDRASPGDSFDSSTFTRPAPRAAEKTQGELLVEKLVEKSLLSQAEAEAIVRGR